MKNNNVVKFTLTAICMAVLSACGSDGDSKPAVASTTNTSATTGSKTTGSTTTGSTTTGSTTTGSTTTGSTTTGSTTTGSTTTGSTTTGSTTTGSTTTGSTTTATNTEGVDNAQFISGQIKVDEKANSHVGAKHVTKNGSDFILNNAGNFANNPTAMNVQLHPALDTVVVAEPTVDENGKPVKGGKYGYLEDFDFRGAAVKDGVLTLNNIYVGNSTLDGNTRVKTATKTASQGKGTGSVLVVDEKLKNYAGRDAKGTVAEVYGHLTRPADVNGTSNTGAYTKYEDSANQNLPLAVGNDNVLNNVQYGRVTTQLNKADLTKFKEGLSMGDNLETVVVGYGKFGDAGTENHYFYRGVNATNANQIAALKGNTFTYNGHAVSYGLDNTFKSFETSSSALPNALGFIYEANLVSGNHVTAKVNFDTMKVTDGSIYNIWAVNDNGTASNKTSNLVTFEGTLHKNGAITGAAANNNKTGADAAGVFAATLYGEKAQEMGGVISSNVKDAGKAWGAVFGANTVIPVKPVTPTPPVVVPTNPFTEATNSGKK